MIRINSIADEAELRDLLHTDDPGTPARHFATGRRRGILFEGEARVLEVRRPLKLDSTPARSIRSYGEWGPLAGQSGLTIRAIGDEWDTGEAVVVVGPNSSLHGIEVDSNHAADLAVFWDGSRRSSDVTVRGDAYFHATQIARFRDVRVRDGGVVALSCDGAHWTGLSIMGATGIGLKIGNAQDVGPDGRVPSQGEGGCSFDGLHIENTGGSGLWCASGSAVHIRGGYMEGCARESGWPVHHVRGMMTIEGMTVAALESGRDRGAASFRCGVDARTAIFRGVHHDGWSPAHRVELESEDTEMIADGCRNLDDGAHLLPVYV